MRPSVDHYLKEHENRVTTDTIRKGFRSLGLMATLLVFSYSTCALADGSTSRLELPDPSIFLTPDTVSLTVIKARPEDAGFKSLFDTAWTALAGADGVGSNFLYKAILAKIQGNDSNAFSALLPAQFVRIDSLGQEAQEPHPTTVTTISGWPGIQTFWYMMQDKGTDGTTYPKVELDDATLILRDGYEDPTKGRVLTRLDGTIASFPTTQKAEYAVERYQRKDTSSPSTEFGELLSSIDTTHDTYGILLNHRGSALKQLRWLNKYDVARAEAAVGQERMRDILTTVRSMTWEGDLVSDDEAKFILKFRTTTPEARKELASMLKDVRTVLDSYGRAGKMETSGLDNELYVNFQMKGYKSMLVGYIDRHF
jgi:hypothetical protein